MTKYEKHVPMVSEILTRKVDTYCETNGFEPFRVPDYEHYEPDEDMIPSLVESVKFWQNARPSGDSADWTRFKWTLYYQIKSKELICLNLLGKADRKFKQQLKQIQKDR